MEKKVIVLTVIVILLACTSGYLLFQHRFAVNNQQKYVACPQEAKICPDGSSIGRVGPNCDFAPCPDVTVGWNILKNAEYNFLLKYPNNFFDAGHEPKIVIGDCNYSIFPEKCPNIDNIVAGLQATGGSDIKAIESNLASPNYWKQPGGEKININNSPYCLYHASDAGMGHSYNYYYYVTLKNNKCVVADLETSTANCDFYLPLEPGNSKQAANYNNCLITNKNQPVILNEIINTFKFNQ